MDLERNDFLILARDWYVLYARLFYSGIREVLFAVKADLIVEDDNVFAFDPLPDIFLALTAFTLTLFETHDELLSLSRVVVSPYLQLVTIDAPEFVSEGRHFGLRVGDERKHDRVFGPSDA